jgi:hypothetical protein
MLSRIDQRLDSIIKNTVHLGAWNKYGDYESEEEDSD